MAAVAAGAQQEERLAAGRLAKPPSENCLVGSRHPLGRRTGQWQPFRGRL